MLRLQPSVDVRRLAAAPQELPACLAGPALRMFRTWTLQRTMVPAVSWVPGIVAV